ENAQFTSCFPDGETFLERLLSLLNIKPEDMSTDIYKYIIYLDGKYKNITNPTTYYNSIRNQAYRILFNNYFNIVNILRSLAEDIGDAVLFFGTDASVIGQQLGNPTKSY